MSDPKKPKEAALTVSESTSDHPAIEEDDTLAELDLELSERFDEEDSLLDVDESEPVPPKLAQLAEQYTLALMRRFPKGSQVRVRVRMARGQAVMDILNVPLDQVHLLADVLSRPLRPHADALGPQLPVPVRPC